MNFTPTGYLIDVILITLRESFATIENYKYDKDRNLTKILIETSYPVVYEHAEKRPIIVILEPNEAGTFPNYNMGIKTPTTFYCALSNFGNLIFNENTKYERKPDDLSFSSYLKEGEEYYLVLVYRSSTRAGKIIEISDDYVIALGNLKEDDDLEEVLIVSPNLTFYYGDLLVYNCQVVCQAKNKREVDTISFLVSDIIRRRREAFLRRGLSYITYVARTPTEYVANADYYQKVVGFQAGLPFFWVAKEKGDLLEKILVKTEVI